MEDLKNLLIKRGLALVEASKVETICECPTKLKRESPHFLYCDYCQEKPGYREIVEYTSLGLESMIQVFAQGRRLLVTSRPEECTCIETDPKQGQAGYRGRNPLRCGFCSVACECCGQLTIHGDGFRQHPYKIDNSRIIPHAIVCYTCGNFTCNHSVTTVLSGTPKQVSNADGIDVEKLHSLDHEQHHPIVGDELVASQKTAEIEKTPAPATRSLHQCDKCHTKTSVGWERDTTGDPIYWHGFRVDCPTCKTEKWVWMKCGVEYEAWQDGSWLGPDYDG